MSTALSVLGQKAYLLYWARTLSHYILAHPANRSLSIQDICDETYIMRQDIVDTLVHMGIPGNKRIDGTITLNKAKLRMWLVNRNLTADPILDPDGWIEYED